VNTTVFYENIRFLEVGVIDLIRKLAILKYLLAFVVVDKFQLGEESRVTPAINIYDMQSMLSWIDMRTLALDLGL
jgi:hypothetical protein